MPAGSSPFAVVGGRRSTPARDTVTDVTDDVLTADQIDDVRTRVQG